MRAVAILLGILILAARFGWWLVKCLVPHFVTVDCACEIDGRGKYVPACDMAYVLPGDEFAGIATCRFLMWLGHGWLARPVSALRPWVNPRA